MIEELRGQITHLTNTTVSQSHAIAQLEERLAEHDNRMHENNSFTVDRFNVADDTIQKRLVAIENAGSLMDTRLANCEMRFQAILASLHGPRAATADQLATALGSGRGAALTFASVGDAYGAALAASSPDDMVIVFGSFYTVADVLALGAV